MSRISFDSRYKFIVSIGLLLLVAPFFIIYILSEISDSVLITNNAVNEYSKKSIEIMEMKQDAYLKILNSNLFYVLLIIIFLLGIIFIFLGLHQWKKVQNQELHKLELENEHFELENEGLKQQFGLTEKEQIAKAEKEISQEGKVLGNDNIGITSKEYFHIEQLVAKKIIEKLALTHDVVNGFKLGDMEYDVVARGKGFLEKDYIFEIKYLKSTVNQRWYNQLIEILRKQTQNYCEMTNRSPNRQVIIVTEDSNYNQVKDFIIKQDKINNLNIMVVEKRNL